MHPHRVRAVALTEIQLEVQTSGPVVANRSARRATARRASARRVTARHLRGDVRLRTIEYLASHPDSTIGDIAKGLNADRAAVARWRR
jgi:hypothetical protein